MRMRLTMIFLLAAICFSISVYKVYGQSSGSTAALITGTVKDPSGAALSGATVTAQQFKTNLTRSVQTDEDGSYLLVQLPPGKYELVAHADGFAEQKAVLSISIGTTTLKDFTLTIVQSEYVEVRSADSSVLEPNKTEKSVVVDQRTIVGLPINKRNFIDFALTTAGVLQDRLPLQGAQATSGLNFNGQNARQNNITIDGLDNSDLFSGSVRATYSQEAVQEFQVVSNGFSAEFGRAQGGVVNIVTRGGTNEFHGNLFFINRNDELGARAAFSTKKEDFSQYQFGGILSGPIKKDKAFFFGSFERLSISNNIDVMIPWKAIQSLNRVGFPARSGSVPFSEGISSILGRVDIDANPSDHLTLRYNYGGVYNGALEPFGGFRAESAGGSERLRDDNIIASNTYVSANRNLVNETRVLAARRDLKVYPLDTNGPRLNIIADDGMNIVAGRSAFLPSPRQERIYQLVNNVLLPRGRNQIKFGVDYLHVDLPEEDCEIPVGYAGQAFFQPINFGFVNFSGLELFDPRLRTPAQQGFLAALGSALPARFPGFPKFDLTKLSIPAIFIQGFGDPSIGLKYSYLSGFVQDDIRITQKLLLKLGLRYDRERIDLFPKNGGNFSPRVALSYKLSKNANLYATYGIFHGVSPFAPILNLGLGMKGNRVPLLPFPFSIIPFAAPTHNYPEAADLPPGVPFIHQLSVEQDVQPNYRNGYTQQVNFGIDYAIGSDMVFSASYQHVRGIKLFMSRDINPVVRPVPGDPIASRMTGRVLPNRGNVQELESAGDSYYNALTLELRRRFSKRVSFMMNYTFSKTLDNYADYRVELVAFQNPLNLRGERGYSVQDVRNRFVFSGVWDLDYSKRPLLRDFALSTIVKLESGKPYNLRTGVDLDQNADIIPGDRPIGIARNQGIAPGFASVDMRINRKINFKNRYSFEAFFEAFNLFNRTNIFVDFDGAVFPPQSNGSFKLPPQENGRFVYPKDLINQAFSPRQLQFGLKLGF